MRIRKNYFLIGLIALLFNITVFANNNFNMQDIAQIKTNMLANIATSAHVISKSSDGHVIKSLPGAVIASPSNISKEFSMDYVCSWVRDSAIVMDEINYLYQHASSTEEKSQLRSYLLNYIKWVSLTQQQKSPIGINILGEPKFNIDGSVWSGKWSRPQNDGAALQAITLMHIDEALRQDPANSSQLIQSTAKQIHPLVQNDLNYVAKNWNSHSYSLWEELNDKTFFTAMVQRKALLLGAQQARAAGNITEANYYLSQVNGLETLLKQHWNSNVGYYTEAIDNEEIKGGSINGSILLGAILGDTGNPNDAFAPNSDAMLSSAFFIRNAFDRFYFINLKHTTAAPMLGRYLNDKYDGNHFIYGNPWFITTNALAEFYYRVANNFQRQGIIKITPLNIYFFQQVMPQVALQQGEIIQKNNNTQLFNTIIQALTNAGDALLLNDKYYAVCYAANDCLHLSEQVDRASGKQISAQDLTWSYASLLTALQHRPKLNSGE